MLLTLVLFAVILGLLVFVHEFGHFIIARRTGTAVEEFGFGFPPRLLGIQRRPHATHRHSWLKHWKFIRGSGDVDTVPAAGKNHPHTVYSLNWIPIGGFVKIKGEQGDNASAHDSFAHQKLWKRALILSSGVAMNFIFAFILITIGFATGLPSMVDSATSPRAEVSNQRIQVVEVAKDSPAQTAQLQAGDSVTAVDGTAIQSVSEFQEYTKLKLGVPVTLQLQRGTEILTVPVTPSDLGGTSTGAIGVWLAETATVRYPWYYAVWMGAKTTVQVTWQIVVALGMLLKNLIVTQHVSADIAGPVGIAVLTGQVARLGFSYILQFAALLSINLAIINFLPFPALDGGRILFLFIEKIRGKPVNQRIEAAIHNVGFLVLMSLVLLVTVRDVTRLSDSIRIFFGRIF